MAIDIGNRFVRRHDAVRGTTSNTTAADISYDTAVLSEDGYTWSSPEVTVDSAGKYLCVFDIGQVDLASTRACGTLVPAINSTNQERFRASSRYLRNSGGSQEGASIGMAILDLSASDDVKVRNPGAITPTDALGNYATNASYGGALQMIQLNDGNFTHVERTVDESTSVSQINTTRPWLDSSATWTQVTFNSEVNDDDSLYSGSGGDITLKADKKYMIVWGLSAYSSSSTRVTFVGRLQIDGTNVQTSSGYQRTSASQGPPVQGMYLHEVGGSNETLKLHATAEYDTGTITASVADAYVQVIELPDGAEWIHVDNGATDSLDTALAGLTTWYDTPLSSTLRADGDSNLSLDSTNNAVQNDSGDTLPVLAIGWHRWDRDSGSSGTRKNPWTRWDNGGSAVGYGIASSYSRGNQSTIDTWQAHYCSAVTLDLANSADLSFQVQDEASAAQADMGIYASTSRYFLGVQVLNLESLAPAGSPSSSVSPSESPSESASESQSQSSSVSPSPSAGLEEYTRGNYTTLPTDSTDLETDYTTQDYTDVDTKNNVRVAQFADEEYALHQFKDFCVYSVVDLEWEGQSVLAPSDSTVYLQIYNTNTSSWDAVDSDATTVADTDFTLSGTISDTTNYVDANNVMSCRVYQLAQ